MRLRLLLSPDELLHLHLPGQQLVFEVDRRADQLAVAGVQAGPAINIKHRGRENGGEYKYFVKSETSSVTTQHLSQDRKYKEIFPKSIHTYLCLMVVVDYCNIPS